MDSTNHPRFDPDYWEWPGKVIVIPFDKKFGKSADGGDYMNYGDNLLQRLLKHISTKPDANPWIMFFADRDQHLSAITFVLDDAENSIYALYTVDITRPVWADVGDLKNYDEQIIQAIDQGDNERIAKLIDKKVELDAGGLSLEGLWATLSEYTSATYESWADIKMDIDDGRGLQIPLILFKAIPKFPHSINKRRIE